VLLAAFAALILVTGVQVASQWHDIMGIVPIGYAVFAVALGIAAGTLLRRTVPAIAGVRLAARRWLRGRQRPADRHPAIVERASSRRRHQRDPGHFPPGPVPGGHGQGDQPASHYWAFQGIETGIFLLLAAALLAITFAVIMRRDA
jgi:hypothetical protein